MRPSAFACMLCLALDLAFARTTSHLGDLRLDASVDTLAVRRASFLTTNRAARTNATSVATTVARDQRAGGAEKDGKLFFLFLTFSGLDRMRFYWQRFFQDADPNIYRTVMHCKSDRRCTGLDNMTVVDTVPTSYCHDLVSAQVQLLNAALLQSESPRDKFIFLSESTIPVKPFSSIYATLAAEAEDSSDFCVNPAKQWKEVLPRTFVVKHSQWVVLSRAHAKSMASNWPKIRLGAPASDDAQWNLPVRTSKGADFVYERLADGWQPETCPDEWAPFASIYGAVFVGLIPTTKEAMPGFDPAGMLDLRGISVGSVEPDKSFQDEQGVCRTFVFFRKQSSNAETARELAADNATRLSCFPKCTSTHPAEFESLSDKGAAALRRSPFLFARKFREGVVTQDQFERILLAPVATPA